MRFIVAVLAFALAFPLFAQALCFDGSNCTQEELASLTAPQTTLSTQSIEGQVAALKAKIEELTKLLADLIAKASGGLYAGEVVAGCVDLKANLYQGARGAEVTKLQQFLANAGFLAEDHVTGYYGPLTGQAVMQLQLRDLQVEIGEITPKSGTGPITRGWIKRLTCSNYEPIAEISGRVLYTGESTYRFYVTKTNEPSLTPLLQAGAPVHRAYLRFPDEDLETLLREKLAVTTGLDAGACATREVTVKVERVRPEIPSADRAVQTFRADLIEVLEKGESAPCGQ